MSSPPRSSFEAIPLPSRSPPNKLASPALAFGSCRPSASTSRRAAPTPDAMLLLVMQVSQKLLTQAAVSEEEVALCVGKSKKVARQMTMRGNGLLSEGAEGAKAAASRVWLGKVEVMTPIPELSVVEVRSRTERELIG